MLVMLIKRRQIATAKASQCVAALEKELKLAAEQLQEFQQVKRPIDTQSTGENVRSSPSPRLATNVLYSRTPATTSL